MFAAPDVSAYYLHADDFGEYMARYGRQLSEMGCDGHFLRNNPTFVMHPLGLDRDTLADIFMNNFVRQAGGEPKGVNEKKVLDECGRILDAMQKLEKILPDFSPDCSVIKGCEKIFG